VAGLPPPTVSPQLIRDADRQTYDALLNAMREMESFAALQNTANAQRAVAALKHLDVAIDREVAALGELKRKAEVARARPEVVLANRGQAVAEPVYTPPPLPAVGIEQRDRQWQAGH